jgi:hypothetical protein
LSEVAGGGLIQELSVADFFHGKEMVDLARIELATSSLRILSADSAANSTSEHKWRETRELGAKTPAGEREQ